MKRTWVATAIIAAGVVAAVTLSACGSGAGTAQTDSTSPAQTSMTVSAGAQGSSVSSAPDASTEPSAGGASATVTISGALDAQSATWFGAVCSGLAPMVEQAFTLMGSAMGAAMGGATSGAPAETQKQLVGTLNSMSSTLGDAANRLGSLPPPTMANGAALATKVVDALKAAAPKMKQAADQLAAATVTNAEQLQQAMGSIDTVMNSSMTGLSLDQYQLDPKITDAVKALPACAPLYSFEQSATATS